MAIINGQVLLDTTGVQMWTVYLRFQSLVIVVGGRAKSKFILSITVMIKTLYMTKITKSWNIVLNQ